jgi:hypothetical protein
VDWMIRSMICSSRWRWWDGIYLSSISIFASIDARNIHRDGMNRGSRCGRSASTSERIGGLMPDWYWVQARAVRRRILVGVCVRQNLRNTQIWPSPWRVQSERNPASARCVGPWRMFKLVLRLYPHLVAKTRAAGEWTVRSCSAVKKLHGRTKPMDFR